MTLGPAWKRFVSVVVLVTGVAASTVAIKEYLETPKAKLAFEVNSSPFFQGPGIALDFNIFPNDRSKDGVEVVPPENDLVTYRSFVMLTIRNEGNKVAESVTLKLPATGSLAIDRSGSPIPKFEFKLFEGQIEIGRMSAGSFASIYLWLAEPYQSIGPATVSHDEGLHEISVVAPFANGWPRWIAILSLLLLPVAFFLGWFLKGGLKVRKKISALVSSTPTRTPLP